MNKIITSELFSIYSNTVLTILGITPYTSWSSMSGPTIVWVLPDEVWPYARTVPLKPSRTDSIIGRTDDTYTSF